ncbi:heparin lyase I family protein [Actinoplanes sp. NPDC049265]|uniref:heparin lyase I family protein n=1 Tax=Actinoplanes sp. NPDC049265 TaxID=3363902 RepID=UPI00371165D5
MRAGRAALVLLSVAMTGLSTTPAAAVTGTTPSEPGTGYVLDFEDPSHWTMPEQVPPGWAMEYWPGIRHTNGEPQVREAYAANGEPVRAGGHSVRFELDKADQPKNNGSRAEIGAEAPAEPRRAERWYGFSTYLPSTWALDRAPEVIVQWHQTGGDCTAGCSPPLSLFTQNGKYYLSQNWQNRADVPGDWTFADTVIGDYRTGRWTDWVFHIKWSTGSDGLLEVWQDGQPLPVFGHKAGRNDDFGDGVHGNYLVLGVYKWVWSQGKPSDTTNRVLYTDELRVADARGSYAAVAPPSAADLRVTTALQVTPGSAGAATTARFTVTNNGGGPATIPYFLAGARNAAGGNVDFPASAPVTLQPGQSYTYQATRSLPAGTYTAWPADYDGSAWHELGPHVSFTVG